jgi:uncharacterized protein YbgA (DUF1722 family)
MKRNQPQKFYQYVSVFAKPQDQANDLAHRFGFFPADRTERKQEEMKTIFHYFKGTKELQIILIKF